MSFDQSKVMNVLLRMVVPLRREFGRGLDVTHFLHDLEYAQDVLAQALQSQDPRLREYASYVDKLMFGPRSNDASAAPPVERRTGFENTQPSIIDTLVPSAPPPPAKASDEPAPISAEDALRAKIMKKYTSGLR